MVDAIGSESVDEGWLGRRVVAHSAKQRRVRAARNRIGCCAARDRAGDVRRCRGRDDRHRANRGGHPRDRGERTEGRRARHGRCGRARQPVRAGSGALGAMVVGVAGGAAKTEQVRALGAAALRSTTSKPDWPDRVWQGVARPVADRRAGRRRWLGRPCRGRPARRWGPAPAVRTVVRRIVADRRRGSGQARGSRCGRDRGPVRATPGGLRELETRALGNAARGVWVPLLQRFPLAQAMPRTPRSRRARRWGRRCWFPDGMPPSRCSWDWRRWTRPHRRTGAGSNEKATALRQDLAAGGPAANAAVTFAALGGEAVLLTALGGHPLAQVTANELVRAGVAIIDATPGVRCRPRCRWSGSSVHRRAQRVVDNAVGVEATTPAGLGTPSPRRRRPGRRASARTRLCRRSVARAQGVGSARRW